VKKADREGASASVHPSKKRQATRKDRPRRRELQQDSVVPRMKAECLKKKSQRVVKPVNCEAGRTRFTMRLSFTAVLSCWGLPTNHALLPAHTGA